MRKGVAIPYVIALVLGVGVIALLGIWFVVTGGRFSGAASDTYCQGQQVEYCTKWTATGTVPTWPSECQNTKYKQPDTTTSTATNYCSKILSTGPVTT